MREMRLAQRTLLLCLLIASVRPAMAIPPLVSGDIPTANRGTYEFFVGYVLTDGGRVTVQEVPFWEVVYGLTERQELTIEGPLVHRDDPTGTTLGFGDVVLGTKYRLFGIPAADSGLSVSLEVRLPTGDEEKGLGSGATNVDLRTRWGWRIAREIIYFNVGYTWVGDDGDTRRDNPWFYAGVWDHPIGERMRILTEVYGRTSVAPDGPSTLAATVGTKWRLPHNQQLQASVGRSLRENRVGGPDLRVYAGWRRDF